jgi:hypothetical protein
MNDFPDWTGPDAPDMASLPHLTALEAFDAMRVFIEDQWERGSDLRWLLSTMNRDTAIWADGGPVDPGMWSDWLLALGTVKNMDLSEEAAKPVRYAQRG